MTAVLMSIKPYWVFLIIAKAMGWNISKEKTIEVRKSYPKDENWNRAVKLYCSNDKKTFAKIPKEYQPLMQQLLGKVIGEFVCDKIKEITADNLVAIHFNNPQENTCLNDLEMRKYADGKNLFLWHISDLVIYDEPKDLSEFKIECKGGCDFPCLYYRPCEKCNKNKLTRPPQSWCYVEEYLKGGD